MSKPFALIVEDEPDLATIFSEALSTAGFETEIIEAGDVALERLADSAPTVVVLDIHLPHVAGTEILTYIRGQKHLADTKVIIATADASMSDLVQADADLVLLKPISFIQLHTFAKRLGSPGT
jgi:DNA-binding response OmpR family regulator